WVLADLSCREPNQTRQNLGGASACPATDGHGVYGSLAIRRGRFCGCELIGNRLNLRALLAEQRFELRDPAVQFFEPACLLLSLAMFLQKFVEQHRVHRL